MNKRMRAKVEAGDAINLYGAVRHLDGHTTVFQVDALIEDMDYCVLDDGEDALDQWIYSIGRRDTDGIMLAATDVRFYKRDGFKCVWLR